MKLKKIESRFSRKKIMQSAARPRKWFNIKKESEKPDVYIFDQIGMDFWGDGVSPQDFINEVKNLGDDDFNLHINSPGGFVYDGLAIYNFLNRLSNHITVYIDGIAASIASIIAMAGDEIIMPENAELMIHNAWTIVIGNKENLREEADSLEAVDKSLVNILHARSGYDIKKIEALMKKETYISGVDAVEMGFATQLEDNKQLAACNFDTLFADDAEEFENKNVINNKRKLEKNLRDAGYSKKESVAIANRSESVSISKIDSKNNKKPITIIMR